MLAKTIVGKQQFVFFDIGHHRIGPMQHRRCHKFKIAFADIKDIAGFDNFKIPAGCIKMSFKSRLASHIGHYFCLRRQFHNDRNISGMIHFNVINNNIFDFGEIGQAFDSGNHFVRHIMFYAVDQRDLVVHNQIWIISWAVGRGIAVKFNQIPVFDADPVNVFFYFDSIHLCLLLQING